MCMYICKTKTTKNEKHNKITKNLAKITIDSKYE